MLRSVSRGASRRYWGVPVPGGLSLESRNLFSSRRELVSVSFTVGTTMALTLFLLLVKCLP